MMTMTGMKKMMTMTGGMINKYGSFVQWYGH